MNVPNFLFTTEGLIVIVLAIVIISRIVRYIKNENSPVLTDRAKIIYKYQGYARGRQYYLVFKLEGQEKTIKNHATREEYESHEKGDIGQLTFQGTRYIDFEPKRAWERWEFQE